MQGKDAEAEGLYRRALVIYEKALGKDHFNVAQTLNNLAVLYETSSQARYAEAEGLYRRALVIYEKALGDNHPEIAQHPEQSGFARYQAQAMTRTRWPGHAKQRPPLSPMRGRK